MMSDGSVPVSRSPGATGDTSPLTGASAKRKPTRILLLLTALALAGLGIYHAARYLWAEHHLRAARRAEEGGDLVQARLHWAAALQGRPSSREARLRAARLAWRAGDDKDAEHHLSAYEHFHGLDKAVLLERSLLHARRGEFTGNEEKYLLSLVGREHPDAVLILQCLIQGYRQTGRLEHAWRCLELWLRRQPNCALALLWRGELEEGAKRQPDALADYRRAVELDPEHDEARLRLAELLLSLRQGAEAATHFEALCQRQPGNVAALLGLARCRRALGQPEEARQLLATILAAQPQDPQALSERGGLAFDAGQPAEAEGWLRKALAASPNDREATYLLAQCLQQQGRRGEADACLAKFRRIEADQQRLADLIKQIAAAPRDPNLRYEAALILLRNGRDPEALSWLTSALREDPYHRATHQALADYYGRLGQPALAASHRQFVSAK
jgi:predicted Zn-dependent protease